MSVRLLGLLSILVLPGWLSGCDTTGNGSVGANLIDDSRAVLSIDTLTLKTATVYMDSVVTQAGDLLIAGSYQDDYLGRIGANSYVAFSLGDDTLDVGQGATYDSLTLRLRIGYHYGDTTQVQRLRIHRLKENLAPIGDNPYLYNFDAFAYETETLGTVSFKPETGKDLEVSVSGTLGEALFSAAQNRDHILTDDEAFQEYVKGFVLVDDVAGNTAVTGFVASNEDSTDAVLRLYYTSEEAGTPGKTYHDFPLSASYFSQITSDWPGPLDQLTGAGSTLPSALADQRTYIQSGVGLMTRVDFPTLDNLLPMASNNILLSAYLYVFPVAHTYEESTPLAQPLVVYVADEHNRISGQLADSEGNSQSVLPRIDDEFNTATSYRFDVTPFIREELDTDRYTGRGLLLSPSALRYTGSVDRAVLGGGQHSTHRMLLWVVFIPY